MKLDPTQIASEMRRTAKVMLNAGHPEIADGNNQIADYIERLERELAEARAELERFVSASEYTRATLNSGNQRNRSGEWVEIHAGRASSSERQLTAAIKQAKRATEGNNG